MGIINAATLKRTTARRPYSLPRLPVGAWVLVLAIVLPASLFLFYSLITSILIPHSSTGSTVDLHLRTSERMILQQDNNNNNPSSIVWSSILRLGSPISCQTVRDRVHQSIWHDPNDGRVYARRLISQPSFYVAVHNQSYDPVRWDHLFVKGKYYEDLVHERFVQILSSSAKKSLVVDVGANIGYYTLLSVALGHSVVAFEINPANLVRLCESLRLNQEQYQKQGHDNDNENNNNNNSRDNQYMKYYKAPRVALFQKGVGNEDGIPLQVLVPKNPGQAYLKAMDDGKDLAKLKETNETSTHHAFTTTVTLDAFAEKLGWLKPNNSDNQADEEWKIAILKLDVEGKEPQIIEGSQRLLQSGRVLNVLTEFRRLARPTIQDAIGTLLDAGYTLVNDESGQRMTRKESQRVLDDLTEKYKGKSRNFDFWFQRASS